MATAGGLQEVLHAAAYGDDPVVLDFSGVSFMDSSGLRALLRVGRLPTDCGPVVIKDPSPQVRRLLDISIPDGAPGLRGAVDTRPRATLTSRLACRLVPFRRRLHDVIRRVMDRRHGAEPPGLIVLERLDELLAACSSRTGRTRRPAPGSGGRRAPAPRGRASGTPARRPPRSRTTSPAPRTASWPVATGRRSSPTDPAPDSTYARALNSGFQGRSSREPGEMRRVHHRHRGVGLPGAGPAARGLPR